MAKPKIFKTNLKVLRAEKNITQEKLAQDIDVSRGTILEIERGTFNPSLKLAIKIANYFDKKVDEIFELIQEDIENE
jgi:Predicted transcriptional regulators